MRPPDAKRGIGAVVGSTAADRVGRLQRRQPTCDAPAPLGILLLSNRHQPSNVWFLGRRCAAHRPGTVKAYGAGVRGILAGLPVIVDANITTTDSSTRDIILGVTADELFLWEQPGSPLLIRAEQTNAANLSVKLWPTDTQRLPLAVTRRARQDHRLGSDNANIRHRSQLIAYSSHAGAHSARVLVPQSAEHLHLKGRRYDASEWPIL